MERGRKLQLIAAIALLASVGAMGLGMEGCHKQQPKEEEKVFAVKRFPRLDPKGSVLGTWEWGFSESCGCVAPEYDKPTIPEEVGREIRFTLHADSSWEWESTGKEKLSGPRFTSVHVERYDARTLIFDSLTLIGQSGKKEIILYYRLCDTCMVENYDFTGAIGSRPSVYYLRERE